MLELNPMKLPLWPTVIFLISIALTLGLIAWANGPDFDGEPQSPATESVLPDGESTSSFDDSVDMIQDAPTTTVTLNALSGADPRFALRVTLPAPWRAEALPSIQAINLYDPAAPGATTLEQSQIFLRYFVADRFLTLQTVDILERTELVYHESPAVRYRIRKKSGVADFPSQPPWRNLEHEVTDVRVDPQTSPSTFYVIARNPTLPAGVFEQFLRDLEFIVP